MLSQDELIALMMSGQVSVEPVEYTNSSKYIYVDENQLIVNTDLNESIQVELNGYGFTPGMNVLALGLIISEIEVISFFKIKLTIYPESYGTFILTFLENELTLETYSDIQLTVQPKVTTDDWIDFRNYNWLDLTNPVDILFKTHQYNDNWSIDLSQVGLKSDSNGLSSQSIAGQLLTVINNPIPATQRGFKISFISTFLNGTHPLWLGLIRDNFSWANPRNSMLASNALENRAYNRMYAGRDSHYIETDVIRGVNWSSSPWISTTLLVDNDHIIIEMNTHSSLNFDWDDYQSGELVFREELQSPNPSLGHYLPCFNFGNANSQSFVIGYSLS